MLTIRLTRKGKKNQPFFRVVVIEKKRSSKGGRAVEDLGFVDPLVKRRTINKERALYWISKGAQPSATVHNLLVSEKIVDAKKIQITNLSKDAKKKIADAAAAAAVPAPVTETPVETAPVVEEKAEEVI